MKSTPDLSRILLTVFLVLALMYFGRSVLVPLAFSVLIAFVIHPVCARLERVGVPRSASILIGELIVFIAIGLIILLLVWQFSAFLSEWPAIRVKLQGSLVSINEFFTSEFNISLEDQLTYLQSLLLDNADRLLNVLRDMLYFSATGLIMLVLIPFYTALILYYRHLWVKAIIEYVGDSEKVIRIVQGAIQSYFEFVKGMAIVYLIVGILNSLGLAILGVPHPILFGVIASILTFIPYIGIIVGSLLPMAVAWVTFNSIWYPAGVVLVFGIVQYLEANIIFPLAVSVRLKVNTLISIVAIFLGALIWGAAGMILFIPFLGILKLVAQEVEGWQPVVTALGDEKPPHSKRQYFSVQTRVKNPSTKN